MKVGKQYCDGQGCPKGPGRGCTVSVVGREGNLVAGRLLFIPLHKACTNQDGLWVTQRVSEVISLLIAVSRTGLGD